MKKPLKYIVILLSVILFISLTGCNSLFNKAADLAKDKIEDEISKSNDDEDDEEDEDDEDNEDDDDQDETEDVSDDDDTKMTTSDADSKDWPEDDMGPLKNVFPKITNIFTLENTTTVTFEGLSLEEAEEYVTYLEEDLGFDDGFSGSDNETVFFTKSDDDGNSVAFTRADDGTGTVTYIEAT